jgi:hypothetical protein
VKRFHRFSQNNNPSPPRSNSGGFQKADKRDQGEIPGARSGTQTLTLEDLVLGA